MITAASHPEESRRLEALRRYEVLDTEAEKTFDDLVLLTSHIFQTPIAVITLVDHSRQWFKAKVGLDALETSRDLAFCSHAILQDEVMIVPDAQQDERFADNPLVTGGPQVRFYAGAPLRDPEGLPLGTLCAIDSQPRTLSAGQARTLEVLARQVINQLELRLALKRIKQHQAQRDQRAKQDTRMLQILAHDLRNPISALVGLAELLAADIDALSSDEAREILRDLTLASQAVVGLVDNILAWSMIDSGALTPRFAPVRLQGLCARAVTTLDLVIRGKELKVHQAVDPSLSLAADTTMLQSMVQNVLTNAIKFTSAGGEIAIEGHTDGDQAVLAIKDSGEGISPEQLARLNQGESVESQRGTAGEAGSGLGFQIVRDFARAHGGRITVRSELGQGATVELRLPLRQPAAPAHS